MNGDKGHEESSRDADAGKRGKYVIAFGIGDLCGVCSRSRLRMLVIRDGTRECVPVPRVRSVPVVMATILVVDMVDGAGRGCDCR